MTRKPLQSRSQASLERMLAAARALMLEAGNEDFTLIDVSKRGNVAIGSIYLRFESKDALVRAVLLEELAQIAEDELVMFGTVKAKTSALEDFISNYVDAYAELLQRHAGMLRLAMLRAVFDPVIAGPGAASAERIAHNTTETILEYLTQSESPRAIEKAEATYLIIFSTLARELRLGFTGHSAHHVDWAFLKRELARMCLAYLKSDD
ncbi:MAG: TetR/AcrR family transcriptional regulator [Alphaproteobacteria bacterium]|nr:TetR/AcrR family transcriptional regulator [Alphaproteobacteria bacterium]MDE2042902.1 TetR/AcrR family transcriptional regulator [Alphaproteobacteria bacterium]MDE2340503.1 TetR/AcrR family transcriptional regulator [Alphaproteobacteria bacterium]